MDGDKNPALAALDATVIDGTVKGYPHTAAPARLGEIAARGWSLPRQDLPFPVAVLKTSALDHNSRWMDRFRREQQVELCPHGKTTMSPHLFRRQLQDGAWGITVANAQQLLIARQYGVNRVVMANQLIDPQGARYVLSELKRDPGFDFYCLVDSPATVAFLLNAAKAAGAGRPLQVLLEGGVAGGRTGCRTIDEAAAVADAVRAASPFLALRGVEGFEGIIDAASPDDRASKVRIFLDFLGAIVRRGVEQKWFAEGEIIVTAGGSAEFDLVAENWRRGDFGAPIRIVLRSGCYLTHDSGLYAERFHDIVARAIASDELAADGPRAALEVWTLVQSMPEPGLAMVTMGKRDVGFDSGLPVPIAWCRPGAAPQPMPEGFSITHLNDQHGYLKSPADSPLRVGDMVGFGVSHPCTTFDRWQLIYLTDDAYGVTGAIRTFF